MCLLSSQYYKEGEEGDDEEEGEEEMKNKNDRNICQLDGNATVSSMSTSDEESDTESVSNSINSSNEDEFSNNGGETDMETETDHNEGESDNEDENEVETISVVVGNRPIPLAPETREPTRTTVKRDNKLVDALSAPRITLYNVRSAWSKWSSISEDMDLRETDLSFYTEVWEQSENRKHQQAIESIFELKGIKYISTPRPGARRGGGTAIACS